MQGRLAAQEILENDRRRYYQHIFSAANVAASGLNLAAYLFMAGNEVLEHLVTEVGKFIFFPFAALTSVFYAVFAWYQFHLERQRHSLLKAILETIGAVAITVAVIGYVAFSTVFSLAAPIIFTVFLGLKTLFQAGTAIYFGWKAATATDHVKKHEYREKVKHAVLSTIAGALTTVAIIGVEIIAKPFLSIFGIVAGAFAAACAVVRIIDHVIKLKAHQHLRAISIVAEDDAESLSSEAVMMRRFDEDRFVEPPLEESVEVGIPLEEINADREIPRNLRQDEYAEEMEAVRENNVEQVQPRGGVFFRDDVAVRMDAEEDSSAEFEQIVFPVSN